MERDSDRDNPDPLSLHMSTFTLKQFNDEPEWHRHSGTDMSTTWNVQNDVTHESISHSHLLAPRHTQGDEFVVRRQKMPISAQEWRVRTGMINASRGNPFSTRAPKASPVKHSQDHHSDLPPPTWKGYRAAMVMLSIPMLHKFYTALVLTITVYFFKDSTTTETWPCTGQIGDSAAGLVYYSNPIFGVHYFSTSLLFFLFSFTCATTIVMILVLLDDRRLQMHSQNAYQWRNACSGTLQCVSGSHEMEESHPLISLCLSLAGSAVHHLPTLALLILVLLCGDVERNPGPPGPNIKSLMEKLISVKSKWHLIGIYLGVKPSQLDLIEDQFPDIGRRLSETLQYWLDGNTPVPVCWESVVEALKCVDKKKLADQLHHEYCTSNIQGATSESIPTMEQEGCIPARPDVAFGREISFPSLSDGKQQHLQARLYADSVKMMGNFQSLLNTIMDSLEARQVPVKRIITRISAFGSFEPVHKEPDQPILKHELSKLRAESHTSTDDIHFVVAKYSSFFNYHIVEQIVRTLGTPKDKLELEEYECAFQEYAKRKVVECPSQLALNNDVNQAEVFVKLDDSYDQCSVSHLRLFVGKLSEVFHIKEGVLHLVSVKLGCIELAFRVPLFVQEATFPLSPKQEEALLQLSVLKLSSGSYFFSNSQCDGKEDGGDDDGHDKPDDDDSAIETGTARSGLTNLSEDIIDRELDDPYYGLVVHGESKALREIHKELEPIDLTLHIASFTGKLKLIQKLVETQLFSPLAKDRHGNTPIHYAAAGNQLEIIKYYVTNVRSRGFSPILFNQNGYTPLHTAARNGNLEVVKYFINEEQLDPLYQDEVQRLTAVHACCLCNNINVVRFLMDEAMKYDTIQNVAQLKTTGGSTLIHFLAARGNLKIFKYVITKLNFKDEFDAELCRNSKGNTPLHLACHYGHIETLQFLITELKCDPSSQNASGQTPLYAAAQGGHLNSVKYLIEERKCNPSQPDKHKWTPLHIAAYNGHFNIVKFLTLEKHTSSECKAYNGSTPLHLAAQNGHIEIVRFLTTELKCDPNCQDISGQNTPLHLAALHGNIETVRFLITELTCDPNSRNTSGQTPLHAAAEGGHLNIVKYLIEDHKCDPSQPDENKITPLHFGAFKGHLNVVKFLTIDKHIDSECRDSDGDTPLHLGAYNGHIETLRFLITELKCDPNSQNTTGQTALHAAAQGGHLNIVEYLIEEHNCDPSQPDENKWTPLYSAAFNGHFNVVKSLTLDKHIDPEYVDFKEGTAVHLAAVNGHIEIVQFLTTILKCDPNSQDTSRQNTPLHIAALHGHIETVKFLTTELKCDPNSLNKSGQTPLHTAAEGGHLNIVEYLIEEHSCNPSQPDEDNWTPLHSASLKGHLHVVKFLTLVKHANPECRDSDGDTPLHLVAYNGHIETLQFLIIELKCDPNSQNTSEQTPLHAAAEGGHLNIVEYLIQNHKCDASQEDRDKWTPLHSAALKGHFHVVKFITLNKGIDPECRDSEGNTPLHLAALYGHIKTVQFLTSELNCDPNSQNTRGQTPLHAAAEGGHLNIVEYLKI